MTVYTCSGCRRLISLSIIPGGNSTARDGSVWALVWRRCAECELLICDGCAPDEEDDCPSCGGLLQRSGEEALRTLMFPTRRQTAPAADATMRTWRGDLRDAVAAGLPVLVGARLQPDGLPDLRDAVTRQRYLRWLCVLSWVARADRVINETVSVELDAQGRDVVIMIKNMGACWGGLDPYGPRAMQLQGRWADPSDEDLLALALRCAWAHHQASSQPHVALELERLDALERARSA